MIYLHVPFCRSFCTYCGFYSETVPCRKGGGEPVFAAYAERVCREIEERLPDFVAANGLPVNTLYIGGGTPSAGLTAGPPPSSSQKKREYVPPRVVARPSRSLRWK